MAILGRNAQIGWKEETSYGNTTPSLIGLKTVPFRSESLKVNTNMARMDVRTGFRGRLPDDEVLASAYVSGDIETLFYGVSGSTPTDFTSDAIFVFLANGLGAYKLSSSPFSMVVRTPDGLTSEDGFTNYLDQSFVIVVNRGFKKNTSNSIFAYVGCKVNEINISGEENNFVRIRFGIVGQQELILTSPTSWSSIPTNPLKFWDTKVQLIDGDNAEDIKVRSFEITINNNYITDIYLNSNLHAVYNFAILSDMPAGNREISGNLEMFFDNVKYYEKFLSSGLIGVKLILASEKITTGKRVVEIYMPKVRITGETPTISGDGVVFSRLNFVALADDTKNELTITYKNY